MSSKSDCNSAAAERWMLLLLQLMRRRRRPVMRGQMDIAVMDRKPRLQRRPCRWTAGAAAAGSVQSCLGHVVVMDYGYVQLLIRCCMRRRSSVVTRPNCFGHCRSVSAPSHCTNERCNRSTTQQKRFSSTLSDTSVFRRFEIDGKL